MRIWRALLVPVVLTIASATLAKQSDTDTHLAARIDQAVAADEARLIEIFKDLHQHPELGFMEVRTANIVARELESLGYSVTRGIAKTGVVGILRNGDGPTVMYRADMDANAVEEATGLAYASKARATRADGVEVPVAHMCGHDAHVTWLLGMARIMAESKAHWQGTLVLVAQPAEELITGARAMVNDGLYSEHGVPVPDYLLGLHTAPLPVGTVFSAGGVRMAGTDQLDVTFHGVGGHGSMPHTTKDPVIMAATAIMQYQTIVSRMVDPLETAVLTVGSVQAGIDNNVIPHEALLKLNLRYFNDSVREQMLTAIDAVNQGIAEAYGAVAPTLVMKGGSRPLVNDQPLIGRLNIALRELLSDRQVVSEFPAGTGSEDMHMLLGEHDQVPYAYLIVGVADPQVFQQALQEGRPVPYAPHGPHYIVDLAAIPLGTRIAATSVLTLLAARQ